MHARIMQNEIIMIFRTCLCPCISSGLPPLIGLAAVSFSSSYHSYTILAIITLLLMVNAIEAYHVCICTENSSNFMKILSMTIRLRDGLQAMHGQWGHGASAIASAMTPYSGHIYIIIMITQGPVVAGNFGC